MKDALMVAGVIFILVGFISFYFHRWGNEWSMITDFFLILMGVMLFWNGLMSDDRKVEGEDELRCELSAGETDVAEQIGGPLVEAISDNVGGGDHSSYYDDVWGDMNETDIKQP